MAGAATAADDDLASAASAVAVATRARSAGNRARSGDRQEHDEHRVGDRPDPTLCPEPETRLDDQRVGDQGQERPAVAQGVEPVRVADGLALPRRLEPATHQRGGRRQDECRQADEHEQDPDEIEDRWDRFDPDRAQVGRGEEQRDDRERRQDQVQRWPPGTEPSHRQVPVQVADEEDALEEEQDGRPDRGRATEHRQHQPAHEGLHAEEEERRQADGQREREGRPQQRACERQGAGGHGSSGGVDGGHPRGIHAAVK